MDQNAVSCGNGLTLYKNDKILNWSKFKARADGKMIGMQKLKFVLGRVEKIAGKGEMACYQYFLLFPSCSQKFSFLELLKVGSVW